jgi:hypothetical protein
MAAAIAVRRSIDNSQGRACDVHWLAVSSFPRHVARAIATHPAEGECPLAAAAADPQVSEEVLVTALNAKRRSRKRCLSRRETAREPDQCGPSSRLKDDRIPNVSGYAAALAVEHGRPLGHCT